MYSYESIVGGLGIAVAITAAIWVIGEVIRRLVDAYLAKKERADDR